MDKKNKKIKKRGKKKQIKQIKKKPVKKVVKKKLVKKTIKKKPVKKVVKKKLAKKTIKIKKKPARKKTIKTKRKRSLVIKGPDIFEGVHKAKIRIIGIGGGGGSIISEIVLKINKADFVAANTDARALRGLGKKVKKFQFGQKMTNGLGTGMNVETGEKAALEEKDKIKKIFEGQDLCIIISCLGGGTSSGATSVFAKIARNEGCLTYGIFTMPFNFEGEKKMEIAKESLKKIGPCFNVFSVIPNERIFQIIDKNTPLQEAFSAINKKLVNNLEGLLEMIYLPGLINIDFADLKTILSGHGRLSYLNTVEIAENHKEEAARKVVSTPLYPYTLKGSRGILYNIVGGKTLCLSDVSKISEIISDSLNKNAKIIFGINQESKYKDKIKITLLAVGCGSKNELIKVKPKEKKPKKKRKRPRAQKPPIALAPVAPVIEKNSEEPTAQPEAEIKPGIKTKSESKPKAKPKTKTRPEPKPKPKKKKKITPGSAQRPSVPEIQTEGPEQKNKIRRNALEVRKVVEQEEKDLLEKETVWDTPAILRRKEE